MKLNAQNYCYFIYDVRFAIGSSSFIFSFGVFCHANWCVCFSILDRYGRWYEIIYKWKRMHNNNYNLYWNNICVWDIPFRTNFPAGFLLIARTFYRRTHITTTVRWKLKTHRLTSHAVCFLPKFEMRQHTTTQFAFEISGHSQDGINLFGLRSHANDFCWFSLGHSHSNELSDSDLAAPPVGSKSLVRHYNIWLLKKRRCKDSLEFRI